MIMMHLVARLRGARRIEELAEQIAVRSQDEVWQRICRRAPSMGMSEARGYIRARAAAVIRQQAVAALSGEAGISPAAQSRIIEIALQEAVQQAIERTLQCARPAPAYRRAA